ncbi:hypothetical protein N0V90_001131 [Kalmusia sp. IMI 367209]|nr:hypothetical protein N0V90_001131 [Kalmusia sp. IMI 367209]
MAHPGFLHSYTSRLTAFEHAPTKATSPDKPHNILLWIGGLGDGPLGVRYPTAIAKSLPSDWSLAEVLISSAYDGWGIGSLKRDAQEVGECVAYFKSLLPGGKVVLMGHSTGCQDIMEYLVGAGSAERPAIDAAILQAGVSDRQAWDAMSAEDEDMKKHLAHTTALAQEMIDAGKEDELLPRKDNPIMELFGAPCTAYRVNSLLAKGGDDDYFSTDLPDEFFERTFGKIPNETRLMLLWGSRDPFVPKEVDKEGVLRRFARFVKDGSGNVDDINGGVVEGATHNLNDDAEEIVQDLVGRVVRFVSSIEGQEEGSSVAEVPRSDVLARERLVRDPEGK